MILLIFQKGFLLRAVVPNEVVGGQFRLRDFVEDSGELS